MFVEMLIPAFAILIHNSPSQKHLISLVSIITLHIIQTHAQIPVVYRGIRDAEGAKVTGWDDVALKRHGGRVRGYLLLADSQGVTAFVYT